MSFPPASRTVFSHPDAVKLSHNPGCQIGVGGQYPGFEVPAPIALGAQSRAGQVGAPAIGDTSIDDHRFEMHAGAEHPFKAVDQVGVAVKIFAEGGSGFPGMQQADGHTATDQIGQQSEKWPRSAPALNEVQIFQSGCGQPKETGRFGNDAEDDTPVSFTVGDEFSAIHDGSISHG